MFFSNDYKIYKKIKKLIKKHKNEIYVNSDKKYFQTIRFDIFEISIYTKEKYLPYWECELKINNAAVSIDEKYIYKLFCYANKVYTLLKIEERTQHYKRIIK